jgi:hypothetical protein
LPPDRFFLGLKPPLPRRDSGFCPVHAIKREIERVWRHGRDTGTPDGREDRDEEQRKSESDQNDDPSSSFKLPSNGALTPEQQNSLTEEEKARLRQLEQNKLL